ncbi:MAG TPA: TRAM domain-containing protein [Myxococcota bacterium]|nr:TRAM domain-containing protein [Myxococcota bacterium]
MDEIVIHALSVTGDGIGRLSDGRVVFVPNALPGDTVRVRLTGMRKRVQLAELEEILVPSPGREASLCPVEACGGCVLKGASAALQAQTKGQAVAEGLRRLGGIDVTPLLGPLRQFGTGWAYRHRVRLHAAWDGAAWQLGYFERRTRKLVPLTVCPVVWPELEALALRLGQQVANLPQEAALSEVELAYSRRDGRGAAKISCKGPAAALRKSLAWFELSGLAGVEVEGTDDRWRHGNLELRYDHRHADKFDLRYEPGLFTQAFPEANDALVEAVAAAIRPHSAPRLLELHAGIGNFSVALARAGARVVAYERNRRAAILGQRNGRAPGLHLEFHAKSDSEALAQVGEFDVTLLDPPRVGAREVAEALAQRGSARVVYVSCDVGTLARDAAILLQGGYRLVSIEAFDLFPQTPHIESLTVFER